MDIPNRRLRPRLGNTFNLFYNSKGVPLITIGPHTPLCLIVVLFFTCLVAGLTYFYIQHSYILASISLFIYMVWLISYALVALRNPGLPSSVITQGDIDRVINFERIWCEKCEIVKTPDTEHCPDCESCVLGKFQRPDFDVDNDHHCPWAGKCVTNKNILPFWIWVTLSLGQIILNGVAGMGVMQASIMV